MSTRPYRYWTAAEGMRLAGLTAPAIAASLARGVVSVRTKLARLGVAKPVATRLLADVCGPHVLADVARRHNLKVNTVLYWKRRYREMGFAVWRCPRGKRP